MRIPTIKEYLSIPTLEFYTGNANTYAEITSLRGEWEEITLYTTSIMAVGKPWFRYFFHQIDETVPEGLIKVVCRILIKQKDENTHNQGIL